MTKLESQRRYFTTKQNFNIIMFRTQSCSKAAANSSQDRSGNGILENAEFRMQSAK